MAMVKCPNCGGDISDKAEYCVHCGYSPKESKTQICPECKSIIDRDLRSCPKCGFPLMAENSTTKPSVQEAREVPTATQSPKPKTFITLGVILIAVLATLLLGFGIFGIIHVLHPNEPDKGQSHTEAPDNSSDIPSENPTETTTSATSSDSETSDPNARSELSGKEIADLSTSVLTLYVYDQNNDLLQTGSGFLAFDNRTIVTNYHVIEGGYSVQAVDERDLKYDIQGVLYYDMDRDTAIIQAKVKIPFKVFDIADSKNVNVGDTVYAIGSPLGLKNTVSNGIISAIRNENGISEIQFTAPISPGSSGGVLLNSYGEVVGITYASYEGGQNLNLAIPSEIFADLPLSSELVDFAAIAMLYGSHIGNLIENYSSRSMSLAEFDNKVYHSYNQEKRIVEYDPATGKTRTLKNELYGEWLNIYKGKLYFIDLKNGGISTYDFRTDKVQINAYPKAKEFYEITRLFVTDYGITIVALENGEERTSRYYSLYQFDFNGNVIGRIKDVSRFFIMWYEDCLIGGPEDGLLTIVDLDGFTGEKIEIGPYEGVTADNDGSLIFGAWGAPCLRINGDNENHLNIGSASLHFQHNQQVFYYEPGFGTYCVSSSGKGPIRRISAEYELYDMCVTNAGVIYAKGSKVGVSVFDPDYELYFVRIDLETYKVEIIR